LGRFFGYHWGYEPFIGKGIQMKKLIPMILLALVIIIRGKNHESVIINPREWILLITGSITIILAFLWDYTAFLLRHYSFGELISCQIKCLAELSAVYASAFCMFDLFLGEVVILLAIGLFYKRYDNGSEKK
jgi:hypothetical protein